MTAPLATTDIAVEVEPADPFELDIIVFDKPGRELVAPLLRSRLSETKVVYRMRGDFYREYRFEGLSYPKRWAAINAILPQLDGALAVNRTLADLIRTRSRVDPVGVAGLSLDADAWPTARHTTEDLRCLTLTNALYLPKIQPIIEWAPVVDAVLKTHGGVWRIGGRGVYADRLREALAPYPRVRFEGYVDAKRALAESNCLLHPSNLDGLPNSILEAMATGLPVITNDFPSFVEIGWPVAVARDDGELRAMLSRALNPTWRAARGEAGRQRVREEHSHEAVGREYERFFRQVLRR